MRGFKDLYAYQLAWEVAWGQIFILDNAGFFSPSEIGFAFHPVRFRYPNEITKAFHGAGRTGGINLLGLFGFDRALSFGFMDAHGFPKSSYRLNGGLLRGRSCDSNPGREGKKHPGAFEAFHRAWWHPIGFLRCNRRPPLLIP